MLCSGLPGGLREVAVSHTARHLFAPQVLLTREVSRPCHGLKLADVTCNASKACPSKIPIGVMTAVTGHRGRAKPA